MKVDDGGDILQVMVDIHLDPPIRTWTYHAFRMSVLGKGRFFRPWILSNFIQMCCRDLSDFSWESLEVYEAYLDVPYGYNFFCPEKFYNAAGLVQHSVDRNLFSEWTDGRLAEFVCRSIDRGFCFYTYLNYQSVLREGNTPIHPSKSNHGTMICGYDKSKRAFAILGYESGSYGLSWVDINLVESAYQETYLESMSRAHQTIWLLGRDDTPYWFSLEKVAGQLRDYLDSQNRLGFGSLLVQQPSSLCYGLETYETGLIGHLGVVQERPKLLYYHLFHALKEHKALMLERIQHLNHMRIVDHRIVEEYSSIFRWAENVRMVMLKFRMRPRKKTPDRMINRLREMAEKEAEVLEKTYQAISQVGE